MMFVGPRLTENRIRKMAGLTVLRGAGGQRDPRCALGIMVGWLLVVDIRGAQQGF